jgi:MFS family permease
MPNGAAAITLVAPTTFAVAMAFGAAPAAIQEMMPNTMRGQASAVYLFSINFIGLGGAPTAVALCTDYLFKNEAHLRYSLALVGFPACLLAAAILTAGLRPFRRTLDALSG